MGAPREQGVMNSSIEDFPCLPGEPDLAQALPGRCRPVRGRGPADCTAMKNPIWLDVLTSEFSGPCGSSSGLPVLSAPALRGEQQIVASAPLPEHLFIPYREVLHGLDVNLSKAVLDSYERLCLPGENALCILGLPIPAVVTWVPRQSWFSCLVSSRGLGVGRLSAGISPNSGLITSTEEEENDNLW